MQLSPLSITVISFTLEKQLYLAENLNQRFRSLRFRSLIILEITPSNELYYFLITLINELGGEF